MEADVRQKTDKEQFKNAEERASKLIDHLLDRMGSNAVFGEPQTRGDITVIPVAEVRTGFGFGKGSKLPAKDVSDENGQQFGTGGGGSVIPLGYIHISSDTVRFKPFYNLTKLTMAGMFLTTWMVLKIGKWLKK
ncbi:MAG TPA: spore germination protein GerW family protein [Balneolales bacterium]|nr:spore germination protein GerW family protein [Balneolales bacterium]